MFKDKENNLSTTKIMAFFGFFTFLILSCIVLFKCPDKFDYTVFAILSAGSSAGIRVLDKYLNVRNSEVQK